ncbi:conserved hypothetical protein [Cenarchaeum symbiosum A]|uniref:PLD phosphodiesterase domain-containing protein n=1 Tax=Cenarchaeum symbiosum (strain A) TaxID=414004 RepID=A0RVA4_CENSY|nr:conserved hypothetical protein [Cenarchaeum symbiosum A]
MFSRCLKFIDYCPTGTTVLTRFYRSPLFGSIRAYLKGGSPDQTIFIFVPYIRTEALRGLLEDLPNRAVIVTSWRPSDLRLGSSDLGLYPFCRERGIALYINEDVHLKAYSLDLSSMILATGNISQRGLMPGGNHEAAVLVDPLAAEDHLFFEHIRNESRLVDDDVYNALVQWLDNNKAPPEEDVAMKDVIPSLKKDYFLISELPMTMHVDALVDGYSCIQRGQEPSDDAETAACIFHDIENYGIRPGLSEGQFRESLVTAFFAHPFIQRIDGFIAPEAYFGRIKEWIQSNCTDVPVPSRRELTGNVQVLLRWFVELAGDRYAVDIPGARSERIRKI